MSPQAADAFMGIFGLKRVIDNPYVCQQYDATRLCRFDRRALDRKCDGCQRVTDREYLESQGLWIEGVSHE
jgi:hypothetical protein